MSHFAQLGFVRVDVAHRSESVSARGTGKQVSLVSVILDQVLALLHSSRMPVFPVVGVMGSGTEEHAHRSQPLGAWLATLDVHLLTGAGAGVMSAVSRAFYEAPHRRGLVIGIVPSHPLRPREPKDGYPHPWVELPIFTHLPSTGAHGTELGSRNHINVLTSDVVVVLPGGTGTASEAQLAVHYRRPVVAYLTSRADVPGLPSEVLQTDALEEVQRFVLEVLGQRGRG
jgi:predicted Rossmann-fold nucleotide-binding protein